MSYKFLQISIAILFCLLVPLKAGAAVLYFEPSQGEYHQGDVFLVGVRIDTEGECINTIEADLSFSQDVLEVVDFSQGNSILTLWVKSPEINQESGLISFSGGIPGGYCGPLPGELGEINLLGKIIFKIQETREGQEGWIKFLEGSQVLLNDGFGTPAKLTTQRATFKIVSERLEPSKDEWQEELEKDNIPPEPFEIEIRQEPAIFEGKYFIVFSTTDKQTGIDHYEVLESRNQKIENRIWKRAESPYLLENQSLKGIIKVKAIDKAGNERIAEYRPKKLFLWWVIILILIGIGVIWWTIKKSKIKYQKSK